MTTPEWLTRHECSLRQGLSPAVWLVMFGSEPQYRLVLTPADGKFTCYVSQTNNGKRLDAGSVHPTPEAALAAGLEELRQKLGW